MKTQPAKDLKQITKDTFRAWLSVFLFSPAALIFIGIMYFGNLSAVGASEILASLDGKIAQIWFYLGWAVFAVKFAFAYIQYDGIKVVKGLESESCGTMHLRSIDEEIQEPTHR